ncbi:MAG: hypothetical protein H6839_16320 [Planctomycetes bacterium]|nr:hypothetical protein [Planctomycetota bacterium]
MSNNEDRIWDVLIEDALREQGAPQQPHEPGDYTRRLLTPVGPMGVDRGRSMRYTRPRWISYVASALALALVCAILYAGAVLLPQLSEANRADREPSTAGANEPTPPETDGHTLPQPAPDPKPEPQPAPEGNQPDSSPEPEPTPHPEPKPDDTVEQPTPEPNPDDTVEQPKPEPKPDDTVEQPKPEPKPDDTVEEPKQPEGTSTEPAPGPRIKLLTSIDRDKPGKSALDYSSDGKAWADAKYLTEFSGDVWFRCRDRFSFNANGALIRTDGTLHITIGDDGVLLQDIEDRVYIDNRGSLCPVSVKSKQPTLTMISGDTLVEVSLSRIKLTVFDGEVTGPDFVVQANQQGEVHRGRFTAYKSRVSERSELPLLREIEDRVAYREDFDDKDPVGRLREGSLKDGALCGGKVFWGYPDNIPFFDGVTIRMRVRFTDATSATLTQFELTREDNFSYELESVRNGEWYVVEVPVKEFLERTTHTDHPGYDDVFQNVSITTVGENAQVELDWVELIRAVK